MAAHIDILKHVQYLLFEHDSVTIPGLGTFNKAERPAQFSADKTSLMPPVSTLVFQDKAKLNDGLLVDHICQVEELPTYAVEEAITLYVQQILKQLRKGSLVNLGDQIGSLTMNPESNAIYLQSSDGSNFSLDNYGLSSLNLPPTEEIATSPEDLENVPIGTSAGSQTEPLGDYRDITHDPEEEEAAAMVLGTSVGGGYMQEKKAVSDVLEERRSADNSAAVATTAPPKRKKASVLWRWIIPLGVLLLFVLLILQVLNSDISQNYNRRSADFFNKSSKEKEAFIAGDGAEKNNTGNTNNGLSAGIGENATGDTDLGSEQGEPFVTNSDNSEPEGDGGIFSGNGNNANNGSTNNDYTPVTESRASDNSAGESAKAADKGTTTDANRNVAASLPPVRPDKSSSNAKSGSSKPGSKPAAKKSSTTKKSSASSTKKQAPSKSRSKSSAKPKKSTSSKKSSSSNRNVNITKANSKEYAANKGVPRGYYVIIGAFRSKPNARKLEKKLSREGYDAHILETASGFYRAGIYTTKNREKAIKQFNISKRKHNQKAWILDYN